MADQFSASSIGGKVPDIIGAPTELPVVDGFDEEFKKLYTKKLVVAKLTPMLPSIGDDANIYNPKATNEWKSDLSSWGFIPPSHDYLEVALSSTSSPVVQTYTNQYGDSEILQSINALGNKATEILNLTGKSGISEFKSALDNSQDRTKTKQILSKILGGYEKGREMVESVSTQLADTTGIRQFAGIGDAVSQWMETPWGKIGWPQMWKNCHFQSSFQLQTKLYCYNTNSDQDYKDLIEAPLAALELFVTPRSKTGILYTAPYVLQFEIPGMIYMPIAYVSSMTVTKGGNNSDWGQTGRPNQIDISMEIQNIYGVSTNSPAGVDTKYKYRPTIRKDMIGLARGKNLQDSSKIAQIDTNNNIYKREKDTLSYEDVDSASKGLSDAHSTKKAEATIRNAVTAAQKEASKQLGKS